MTATSMSIIEKLLNLRFKIIKISEGIAKKLCQIFSPAICEAKGVCLATHLYIPGDLTQSVFFNSVRLSK